MTGLSITNRILTGAQACLETLLQPSSHQDRPTGYTMLREDVSISHTVSRHQTLQDLFFSEAVSDQRFQVDLSSQSFGSSWDVASHSSVRPSAVEHAPAATVPELDADAVAAAEERQEQKRRAKVSAHLQVQLSLRRSGCCLHGGLLT